MNQHISFPSIEQYKNVIKHIRDSAKYHECQLPVVKFVGSVKLHGTNAAVCRPTGGTVDDHYQQSRERLLTLTSDNAGFCAFTLQYKDVFEKLFTAIETRTSTKGIIQIYGEWCGGNIQKGVGLNHVPKQFVIFGIRVSDDAASQEWASIPNLKEITGVIKHDFIKCIHDFQTWEVDIDFNDPAASQNKLVEITEAVEKDCPVARKLLGPDFSEPLIGEGAVWVAVESSVPAINVAGVRFKVKGKLHSASKVKTLAAVDEEKMATVAEFVDAVCTESRLQQGIDVLKQRGLEVDANNISTMIKWFMGDIIKEESPLMVNSGLCVKDITGPISRKVRDWYLNLYNSIT